MQIKTKNLTFYTSEDGAVAGFFLNEKPETASHDGDLWRLILDDGLRTEIPVYSRAQKGTAREEDGALILRYPRLVSAYGDGYDITFTVTVRAEGELFSFTPEVENREPGVRVNECFCPLACFDELSGEKAQDQLFVPTGLGRRIVNPWKWLRDQKGDYYHHNDEEIFWHQPYPRASMGWFGVQSGDKFLYIARYDEKMRYSFQTVRQRIRREKTEMMLGIDHFPMARTGERLTLPTSVVGLLDGDWREGAKTYRAWADAHFFTVRKKADWVKRMTGWQRIIMRSQYGEDYYKAEDLPAAFLEGKKRGIDTVFLFAWWKEGMDRNYPHYTEAYPGAFADLTRAMEKIRSLGGRVILECNSHFMDPHADFYREHGEEVRILDINGNEFRPAFVYPGQGELRAMYGAVQFPICCAGTKLWRDQLDSQFRQMSDLGADCVFADCYGACPHQPCFNDRHEHGVRVDEEWIYHRQVFDRANELCDREGKVFAAEIVTDIAASYTQFLHGLINVDLKPKSDAFPALFRYTFPEVVTTNRGVRGADGDYEKCLKTALLHGLRYDAELYVCRADLSREPEYARVIEWCTGKMKEYGDFFFDGRYTVLDVSALPAFVRQSEFESADGKRILRVLYNLSDREETETRGVRLAPGEMKFEIFEKAAYLADLGGKS